MSHPLFSITRPFPRAAGFAFLWAAAFSESSFALNIGDKTIPVYGLGPTKFITIKIDGGEMPIRPSDNVEVRRLSDYVTLDWPHGKGHVTINTVVGSEADLLDKTGQPVAQELWERVAWQQIDATALDRKVRDFQPNVLNVNGWTFSAISVDYTIGAIPSSNLLLIWRAKDGTSIAVKLSSPSGDFEKVRAELYHLIGGSMLMIP